MDQHNLNSKYPTIHPENSPSLGNNILFTSPNMEIYDLDVAVQTERVSRNVVDVIVGKRIFKVKRETLIRNSGYFKQALVEGVSQIDITCLTNDYKSLRTLLRWMKGKGLTVTKDNVSAVMGVALKLNITAVIRLGIDFILGELSVQDNSDLFPVQNTSFENVIDGSNFLHFSASQMYKLLSDDRIAVKKEKQVFDAAVKWLHHDWARRQRYAAKLMGCVRFGLMSDRDILDITHDQHRISIMEIPECQSFALTGMMFRIAQTSGSSEEYQKFAPRPRLFVKVPPHPHLRSGREEKKCPSPFTTDEAAVQQITDEAADENAEPPETKNSSNEITSCSEEFFDCVTNSPRDFPPNSFPKIVNFVNKENDYNNRKSFSLVNNNAKSFSLVNDPCILLIGGLNQENRSTPKNGCGIWRYSPRDNKWELIGELPQPRIHAGASFVLGTIYVIGGCTPVGPKHESQLEPLSTVWTYRIDCCKWSLTETLLYPRMHHGVCECQDRIYAIGGSGKDGVLLDSVECYDPLTAQWSSINPLKTARMSMAIGVLDKHIFICGGFGDSTKGKKHPHIIDSVECLCVKSNCWHACPRLRQPRCFAAMTSYYGQLYIIGGSTYDYRMNLLSSRDVDILDTTNRKWRKVSHLDLPRHGAVAIQLGQHLHVIGGMSTNMNSALSSVECYAAGIQTWVKGVAPLPTPLIGMCGVLIPPGGI